MDFSALFTALQQNVTGTILALALLALAFMYRRQETRDAEHRAEIKTLNEARLADVRRIEVLALKFVETSAAMLDVVRARVQEG